MSERGKSLYAYISATSNTVVATKASTLYSINGNFIAGTIVRVDDTHRFAQGVLDINAAGSNTVGAFGAPAVFPNGIGFNAGIAVAVSSNSRVVLEYE